MDADRDARPVKGLAVLGLEHVELDRNGVELGGPRDRDDVGVAGVGDALGAKLRETLLEGEQDCVVEGDEDRIVGTAGLRDDLAEPVHQALDLLELLDLDDQSEIDLAGELKRLGERRNALAGKARIEP